MHTPRICYFPIHRDCHDVVCDVRHDVSGETTVAYTAKDRRRIVLQSVREPVWRGGTDDGRRDAGDADSHESDQQKSRLGEIR